MDAQIFYHYSADGAELRHFEGLKEFLPVEYTPKIDINDLNPKDQELAKNGELDKNRELVKKHTILCSLIFILVPKRARIYKILLRPENC